MSEHLGSVENMVIEMSGTFDVPAAERVVQLLGDAGEREVRIDLTHVRDFHDFGLAVLARGLSSRRRVSVSGLRTHQVRLLRYLGIDADVGVGAAFEPDAASLA